MEIANRPSPKLTPEQRRILCVGNWLKRYSQIYPMYGKSLGDFPERFKEFLDEFQEADPDSLDAAFRAARGTCTQFPTPADVRAALHTIPLSEEFERRRTEIYERRKAAILAAPPAPQLASVQDARTPAQRERAKLPDEEQQQRVTLLRRQLDQLQVVEEETVQS